MRLNHCTDQIPRPQRTACRLENNVNANAKHRVSQERTRREANGEAEECEERKRDSTRDDAGCDKVINGMGAEDTECVCLLGDLHGAKLRGKGAADTASDNDGGDDRAKLACEGEGEDAADRALEAEASEFAYELDGESHADKGGSEEADAKGARADAIELLEGVAAVDTEGEGTVDDLAGEYKC